MRWSAEARMTRVRAISVPFSKQTASDGVAVKAEAYGHGMIETAKVLDAEGTHLFGVADINEGIILRGQFKKKPILVFEHILPSCVAPIVDYNLTATVSTLNLAKALNTYAKRKNKKINIHIKIDTGMGRLGVWHEEALGLIKAISRFSHLYIEGIYTHFASADFDKDFTRQQILAFSELISTVKQKGIPLEFTHAANSAGSMDYPLGVCNAIRPGLALYGMHPHLRFREKARLKPVLTVKTKIIFLKKVQKKRSISYGRTFFAPKDLVIATLPIGYNDGYLRCLSNKAFVLAAGQRCPVVGRVTMDQLMVDVTKAKGVHVGSEAVLLGRQGQEEISADELAQKAGTINYEITCSLGNRLPHIYKP